MGNFCCGLAPIQEQRQNVLGNDGRLNSKIDISKVPENRAPLVALELQAKKKTKYRRRKRTFEPKGGLDFTKDPELWELRNILDEPVGRFYMREYIRAKEQTELGVLVEFWIQVHNLKINEEEVLKTVLVNKSYLDNDNEEEAQSEAQTYIERPNSIVEITSQMNVQTVDLVKQSEILIDRYLRDEDNLPVDDAELKKKTYENAVAAIQEQDVAALQDTVFVELQNAAIKTMAERKLFSEFKKRSEYARYRLKFAKIYNKITYHDFDYMQHLGRGSFGRVLRVRKKTTGKLYAMKVMAKRRIMDGAENSSQVTIERKVMVMCNHPNIVKAYFCFQTSRALLLVMELLEGGNLEDCRSRMAQGKLPANVMRFQSAQMILALSHLHHHGILYRDMKPVNVMLDRYGNAILTDLGLCAKYKSSQFPKDTGGRTVTGAKLPSRKSMKIVPPHKLKCVGTMNYRAPELLTASDSAEGYGPGVDFFALGVTMYYLMSGGTFPYRQRGFGLEIMSDNKKLEAKYQQTAPKFEKEFKDPNTASLLRGLLELNYKERLGYRLEDLKDHPFYREIDFDLLQAGKLKPPYVPVVNEYKAGEAPKFTDLETALTQFSADNILELFGGENEMNMDYKHVKEKHQKYFKEWDYTPDVLLEEDWQEAELNEEDIG